jgi:hypothetical protein
MYLVLRIKFFSHGWYRLFSFAIVKLLLQILYKNSVLCPMANVSMRMISDTHDGQMSGKS